jgi:hypothetical protein
MYTIVKSISSDFTGGVAISNLTDTIRNSSIATTFYGIQACGDVIEFYFENSLSSSEQTTFNNILSGYSYTPDPVPKNKSITVTPRILSTNNTSYTVLGSFQYLGSGISGTINYIELVSYADPAVTSYDARIVIRSTGTIIASKTGLTNKDYAIVDLGAISNVPTNPEILDLQVKKTGGPTNKYVYVDNIYIYN